MRNFVLFLAFLPSAAVAQPARVGVSISQVNLTLQAAVDLALKNNLDIEIERTNVANAKEALKAAMGVFDPNFRFQPGLSSTATPTASVLQGAGGKLNEHSFTANVAYNQRTPWWGSAFNVLWDNSRYSTSNSFASLNPTRSSRLLAGFSTPLFRNRAIDSARGEVKIRRKQMDISDVDFEVRVIDTIARVEQAYWNLVAARQDVMVQAEGVNLAKEQLERNQRMIAAGTLAPVELAASEAEYQRRLDLWYASVSVVTEVENSLKLLLTPDRNAALWGDEIVPADLRTREPEQLGNLKDLLDRALKQRPELQQLSLRLDVTGIQGQIAAEQVKPQVNLVASYWNSGMGGDLSSAPNPFSSVFSDLYGRVNTISGIAGMPVLTPPDFGGVPPFLVGGYGTALSNMFSGRYQSVQVGVAFDLTLRNRTASAGLAQTKIAARRIRLEQTRLEQAIEAQVRNALQSIESTRQRIVASAASQRAAQEKFDSELRLFQTGESTNFLVLTRQNDLLDAKRRSVLATLDFNRALSRLEQSVGATLQWYNISLK